jgi:hypothetical protein
MESDAVLIKLGVVLVALARPKPRSSSSRLTGYRSCKSYVPCVPGTSRSPSALELYLPSCQSDNLVRMVEFR